ncbi:quinol:cytochrome C oxidoreductase [Galbibacter sp. EGI 63066]|uniref:quinol:cytochrome C oxidoreductase n=1 Tax=Galbibacter sp. EGI 63066 TaxID=2993559 RepID=UPI0022496A08|nr:quinol:cytochrome C oxidoreductase [Galbibacter sp. EGI 63066]MCX2681036.1 quinol:cytochrome C oxidoreductase [Galbibacter sp. EGI 63066]
MYTFSNRLRIASFILMIVGVLGIGYGFFHSPSTVEEAKALVAQDAHHGEAASHGDNTHEATGHEAASAEEHHGETSEHGEAAEGHQSHDEHTLAKLQNRPWAAVFVAAFFFFMLALGTLVFYAVQRASQAGWSPVLFRVMEGITAYLFPGALIIYVFMVLTSGFHMNHLFIWMDPNVMAHDEILQLKSGYLNIPFFLIRSFLFLLGWCVYRYFVVRNSVAQDEASDYAHHKRNFKISIFFLLFFFVTEAIMAWDWFMGLEPHWYSTLFAWYIFASMFVSGVTVIAMVTMYLKSKGVLDFVNDSHLHDLAKYMFGLSIFWTYLWFGQFMLIWYANIPEEAGYFLTRIEYYNLPFFGMLVLNFVFPFLVLMNSDFKRMNWFVMIAGISILIGHYIDIFQLVMPSTVGEHWSFGVPEIGSILFFLGLFIFVVFNALSKTKSFLAKGDPFVEESKQYHY